MRSVKEVYVREEEECPGSVVCCRQQVQGTGETREVGRDGRQEGEDEFCTLSGREVRHEGLARGSGGRCLSATHPTNNVGV